jgi:hypothetical protein
MKLLVGLTVIGMVATGLASDSPVRPFTFFEPTVQVTAADRDVLDRGGVIARVLPADDGHIAFFAAARLKAGPAALIDWTREIAQLKRGPMVLAVGRLSTPVADDDLDALVLDANEVDDLKRCRVGKCELKLAAGEIVALQQAIRAAGAGWRDAVQREFRRILIARVRLHARSGLLVLPPYADHGNRMSVGEAFSAMTARSAYLTRAFPDVINALLTPRYAPMPRGEAFYYWSRERLGGGKTVVTVTYVQLLQSSAAPQAVSASAQLYASHYLDGALGVTAVLCDETAAPQESLGGEGACYLGYLNRTRVDLLGGVFGGIRRAVIEDRIESEGPRLLREVTRRLESGRPHDGREVS